MSNRLTATTRATPRRKKERGSHDRALVDSILDEGLVAHVGVVTDEGPVVLPFVYARLGDDLYLHGAPGNHLLRALTDGAPACITVTLIDSLVLARSALHHSMDYRCVVLFGTGERVTDPGEQRAAVDALLEHMVPGQSTHVREITEAELRSTAFVRFPIDEGSAKVRTDGVVDDPADLELDVWAGVVPVRTVFGSPVAADARAASQPTPDHVVAIPPIRGAPRGHV
jgi:nitroimidazol reductase NimA-like FMN-containing flavoprotein (pyridoxamine 5'-phosphate oxidase superfamily)